MKEICIQGLGFVGIATATAIASIIDNNGLPKYNVTGIELNNENSLKKIESINMGELYFFCEDESFKLKLREAVLNNNNLKATCNNEAYKNADIVIVAINLDVEKNLEDYFKSKVSIEQFKNSIRIIGKRIKPDCLILVETTIPPGTSRYIIEKIISEEFRRRKIEKKPLICHSYERVTPGKDYLGSITNSWRNYSANCEAAKIKAEILLNDLINIQKYPLLYFENTNATEVAKILENSYRAVNIAFIYEWTLFAEEIGINLFEVIEAIKKRKGTHDNIMKPGFGVGGYCLPKDAILAQWSLSNIFNIQELKLSFSIEALKINDHMPLHTYNLITKEIGTIKEKKFLICGASYLADVFDIRNSPSKKLYEKIKKEGGICHISDPHMRDNDFFFDEKDIIKKVDLLNYDVIIFSVRYVDYLNLNPHLFAQNIKKNALIVDTFDILNDEKIKIFLKEGVNVIGVGKGHIKKIKEDLSRKKY